MSDKCDKCGKDCLEYGPKHIPDLTDRFFYQGKFFEKEDDFWAYVKDFTLRQTSAEDFDGLFDMLKKDVWMNIKIRRTQISNGDLRTVLDDTLVFILLRIWKEK